MTTFLTKTMLGTALAATALTSMVAGATPAAAHEWGEWGERHHNGGDGAAIAIGAGLLGLVIGAAIASDHHDRRQYDQNACYEAYPGYSGYCYPASYYTSNGWCWRDGGWWYGGTRYARPYIVGGYRGGYGQYRGYQGGGSDGGYYGGNDGRRYESDRDRRRNWGDDNGYDGRDREDR